MHLHRLLVLTGIFAALGSPCAAQPSSLKERAAYGGTMSAADHAAVMFSAIELCEQRMPDFRSQAASHVARIRATPGFQELARSPEYNKVLPEARVFVRERYKPEDLPALCRDMLDRVKS
jgi:hypothetical protein